MRQPQNKLFRQSIEANLRLQAISACEGIQIDFTGAGILLTDAKSELNLRQLVADMEHDGIAVEAKNFYCG